MKIKQLEALRNQHNKNMERKQVEQPSLTKAISLAIISGQALKLRKPQEIMESARKVIAECACSYGRSERTLNFSEIFAFDSSELDAYKKAAKAREAMIKAYSKIADKIMRRAELDETADATELSEQLAEAAHEAGLLS